MSAPHEETYEATQTLDVPDETSSLFADTRSEWMDRAEEVQRGVRLLQWMMGTAIVLAATVLLRVFTH